MAITFRPLWLLASFAILEPPELPETQRPHTQMLLFRVPGIVVIGLKGLPSDASFRVILGCSPGTPISLNQGIFLKSY